MRRWSPTDLGSKLDWQLDQRGLVVGTGYSDDNDQSGHGVNFHQGTTGAQPATGRTINGYAAPDFDGSNDRLDTTAAGKTLADVVDLAAHEYAGAMDIDATTSTATPQYLDDGLFGDAGGYWGVTFATISGAIKMFFMCWDTVDRSVTATLAAFGVHTFHSWHESGQNNAEVDGVTQTPVSAGNLGSLGNGLQLGRAYSSGAFFNGAFAFVFGGKTAWSADERALARHYVACKSGRAA